MKKLLTLFFLFGCLLSGYTQVTQGQIFNFQIGDVIQSKFSTNNPPVLYRLDTIVGKTISADTITYTIKRFLKTDGPPPYPLYQDTLVFLNIVTNQTAQHYSNGQTCLPIADTLFTGNCGEGVHERRTLMDTSCFEPRTFKSSLHAGVGGPFYESYDPSSNGLISRHDLLYFNTAQWGPCGTYKELKVGLDELDLEPKTLLQVYDLLGRPAEINVNETQIYRYSDGSTEKIVRIK